MTYGLWKACHEARACEHLPPAPPADNQDYPVTRINAQDIEEFSRWLNAENNAGWRLPSLTEWRELSAELPKRKTKKLFTDPRLAWAADYDLSPPQPRTVQPSGAFGALANGLRDMGGNVFEWTGTCVMPDPGRFICPAYFVTGAHEAGIPIFLRDPATGGCAAGTPPANLGFRLVREL